MARGGEQDATHVLLHCQRTEEARQRLLQAARDTLPQGEGCAYHVFVIPCYKSVCSAQLVGSPRLAPNLSALSPLSTSRVDLSMDFCSLAESHPNFAVGEQTSQSLECCVKDCCICRGNE